MNRHPLQPITDEEVAAYQADGIVVLRGLFDAGWVGLLRQAADEGLDRPTEFGEELAAARGDQGRFFHDTFMWRQNELCRRFVFDSPAAEIAAMLMRAEKVNIFFDQWLIKEPGTPARTPWHHDLPYWPIDGWKICSLWLALDPVTPESGAVEYIKGSHRWGRRYKPATFSGQHDYREPLPPVPDIDAMRDELQIVQFELQPGDCTIHHGLLVHGAPGNTRLDRRRRASVTRWAGDDAVYRPREGLQDMPADPGIAPDGPIDCDLWPRVWPQAEHGRDRR
jgi:ectoine hydroxylase-related dioxygenase (phytanoyl-CoA dioxygenase family)